MENWKMSVNGLHRTEPLGGLHWRLGDGLLALLSPFSASYLLTGFVVCFLVLLIYLRKLTF